MPRRAASGPGTPTSPGSTRERILDIALDLFVEKGYEAASLREIAEALGFSKAAVYYHFASKDEILMALHLRMHQVGERALGRLGKVPASPEGWGVFLRDLVEEMMAHRKLLVLHARNFRSFQTLGEHDSGHDDGHEDLEASFRAILSDASLPLATRVRMIATLGALLSGMMVYAGTYGPMTDEDELAEVLRGIVDDLLGPREPDSAGLSPAHSGG